MELLLNKEVVVKEDFGDFKKGEFGLCTADLINQKDEEDIFAVMFKERGWITFKGKGSRNRFEIIDSDYNKE